MKVFTVVKDSVTLTFKESHMTSRLVGDKALKTPERQIVCSDGCEGMRHFYFANQWYLELFPAGCSTAYQNHVSMCLRVCVNGPVKATFTFAVVGSSFSKTMTHVFSDRKTTNGFPQFVSHEQIRPLSRNGLLTITCNVEFFVELPFAREPPETFSYCEHIPTDFDVVVGKNRLQVHRSFLEIISPVFYAMLNLDTAESRSGEVKITDFDFDTVKAAIDYCYGREIKISVDVYIQFLSAIVSYACDYSKDELLFKCCENFKKRLDELKETEKFSKLSPKLVAHLLRTAFDFKSNIDLLRYACKNGVDFIVDHLERPFIDSMTLDNICPALDYAWEFSRDELKMACERFIKDDSFGEVTNLVIEASFVDIYVQLLRIARKYEIKDIITLLESIPKCNLTSETFVTIISYACDYSKQKLLTECFEFFMATYDEIRANGKFTELTPKVIVCLLRFAFPLKADSSVSHDAFETDINIIKSDLEPILMNKISTETFCDIFQYAHDYTRHELLSKCYDFIVLNHSDIPKIEKFAELPIEVIFFLFRNALDLESDFHVLHLAYSEKDVNFIAEALESHLIKSITLNDFCTAVNFAWSCSSDVMKYACAAFLNDNYGEVMNLELHDQLSSEYFHGVLKLAYDLKNITW
uniref:BTB domain-containing protein n=1 Tax=Panagrellus redivivus TaxID=6233 RepID=A0A7E4UUW2_PANRE